MAWIPALVLLAVALACRYLSKSWLAPSAFISGMWFIYLSVPLAIASEYNVSPVGPWVIAILVMSASLGAALTESRSKQSAQPFTTSRLVGISVFLSVVAFVGAAYYGYSQIQEYGLDLNLGGLLLLGRLVYQSHELGNPPILTRATIICVFPAAILGGIAYQFQTSRKRKTLCLAPFVPALTVSLVNATKANLLMAIVLWISGWLAVRVRFNFKPIPVKKIIGRLAVASALACCLFITAESLRAHKEDAGFAVLVNWSKIKANVFGHVKDFDYWITHRETLPPDFAPAGFYTFGGVFESLGTGKREVGVYQEFVMLDGENDNNVFTAFRGMISDFSFVGAMLLMIGLGAASGYSYSKGNLPMLATFFAFVIWSPLGSPFIYNGSLVAIGVGILALKGKRPEHDHVILGYRGSRQSAGGSRV